MLAFIMVNMSKDKAHIHIPRRWEVSQTRALLGGKVAYIELMSDNTTSC
jgi:hypothetical protein